ncbi:MAG: two-component regulator propeller domain-containing protein [Caldilineales bacterium]
MGGHPGGRLNRLDLTTDRWSVFQHDPANRQTLSSNQINAIEGDDSGLLWISTNNGLNSFDPDTGLVVRYPVEVQTLPDPDYLAVHDAAVGSDQTVWIATDGGLAWLAGGSGELKVSDDRGGLPGVNVFQVHADRSGNIWAGTDGGLYKLDNEKQVVAEYHHDPANATGLGPGPIRALFEDARGRLWLGMQGGGLTLFDPASEAFTHYRHDPDNPGSLLNDFTVAIGEDSAGTVWASSWAAGLNLLSPYISKFPAPLAVDATPLAILGDSTGELWVGTFGQGLAQVDPATGETSYYRRDPSDPTSLHNDIVFALQPEEQGRLWVGTFDGLSLFDPVERTFSQYPLGEPGIEIRSLFSKTPVGLWVGTSAGLLHVDTGSGTVAAFNRDPAGPMSNEIWSIAGSDPDTLWVGATNGLFRLTPATGEFQNFSSQSGTTDTAVTVIRQDADGILWLGTWGQGLIRFDPASQTSTHYQSAEGLPGTIVLGILGDAAGNLWLSTNKGLTRFDPASEQFRTYDTEDGLAADDFAQGAYWRNEQGEMFLGIANGIVRFVPQELQDNPQVPPVYLTDFQIFNQSVSIGPDSPLAQNINHTAEIELAHDQSVLSFEFAALNFINPQRNQYAYKMDGVDPDWNLAGDRRFVTYTNLDPGQYTLHVRGSNNDGVWSEEGVSLHIVVKPPWWRTTAAYLIYGALILLIVGGYARSRTKAQQRQLAAQRQELMWERRLRENLEQMDRLREQERARIAGELHDGLAQTLAGIRFRAQTWKTLVRRDPEQLLPELDDLGVILDTSIEDVRRSIDALQPVSLEQLGLEAALLQLTTDLALLYQVSIETDFHDLAAVHDSLGHDLFRIVQELVYNAVQHGRPSLARVTIRVTDTLVSVQVKDNGVGFTSDSISVREGEGHYGLKQVRERVHLLKGAMTLDSAPNQGTTVSIDIPLVDTPQNG